MFRYYSNPAFSAVEPTRGSSNGGVRVTITGAPNPNPTPTLNLT